LAGKVKEIRKGVAEKLVVRDTRRKKGKIRTVILTYTLKTGACGSCCVLGSETSGYLN